MAQRRLTGIVHPFSSVQVNITAFSAWATSESSSVSLHSPGVGKLASFSLGLTMIHFYSGQFENVLHV